MSSQTQLVLQRILGAAASSKASEIHFSPGEKPLMRSAGVLENFEEEAVVTSEFVDEIVAIVLTKEQQIQFAKTKDFTTLFVAESARFKVHMYFQESMRAISFIPLPTTPAVLSDLNIPGVVTEWVGHAHGIIVVAGPHSSGVGVVAAACIETINQTRKARIITLEDPQEMLFKDKKSIVEQREIGKDVSSFALGIESCLKEDVDVVLISDIPTKEVAEGIVKLASSGVLVVASMTAVDSIRALAEWANFFEINERVTAIRGVSKEFIGSVALRNIPKAGGGSVFAAETLVLNQAAQKAFEDSNWPNLKNILATSREQGMTTLSKSLSELANMGTISQENARAYTNDKEDLERLLNR